MTTSPNFRDPLPTTPPGPAPQPRSNGHRPEHALPETAPPLSRLPRSRVGQLWVTAVVFALVLLLLLVFVLENGQRSEVSFFGAHGHLPMGVALLLAAIFGVLLVALPGTARIVQLRLLDRRRGRPRVTTAPLNFAAPAPSNGTRKGTDVGA
jgi:uncharacterized integral membrane protein